ncbi:MAG: exo-alpha-sialidase [bacterium]
MRLQAVLFLAVAGIALGQWEPERRVTSSTGILDRTARGNARAVTMRNDTVHVAYESHLSPSNSVIRYTRSTDGGATWEFDSVISVAYDGSLRYSPSIALSGNMVHVAWASIDLSTYQSRVRYRRSINSGVNWESQQTCNSVTAYDRYIDPSLAVNGSVLHVTYGDTGADTVFYARSTDNGVNWAPGAMGYTIDRDAVSSSVATNGSGLSAVVLVAYSYGPDADRAIYVRRSTDRGSNWQARQLIDSLGIAATASCVLMRGNNAYLVYQKNVYGTNDIFLAKSTDAGVTWSAPVAIDSGPLSQVDPSFNRSVANTVLHVAYTDYSLPGPGIAYRSSVDEGATWSAALRVDAGAGPATRPTVSVNGRDTVAVCWTDGRWSATYPDVYFRRSGPSLLDVGVSRILAPTGVIDSTQSVAPACSVTNYGTYAASFRVRCRIGGFYSDSAQVTGLQPGNRALVNFPAYAAWPRGTHLVKCSTALADDAVPANDYRTTTVRVRVFDAEADSILAPTDTVDSGTVVTPRAWVRNVGTDTAVFYARLSIGAWRDSVSVTVPPSQVRTATFANWTALARGNQTVRCTTMLSGDMVPPNNVCSTVVTVRVLDAQAVSILAPSGMVDSGAPVTPRASVRNDGTGNVTFYTRMSIGAWADSQQVTLAPGAADTLSFAQWTPVTRGLNAVRCSTMLTGDMVPANNLCTVSVSVRVLDVGVSRILAPTDTIDSTQSVAPACSVTNYGTQAASFKVRCRVGGLYADSTQVIGLQPGTRTLASFPARSAWLRGTHLVACSTELANDAVTANDKRTAAVTVRVLDAQAVSILAPIGTVDSGSTVTPRAQVRNNGTANATFYTQLVIGAYVDSQQVTLSPGGTQALNFAQWTAGPRGSYPVTCSTRLTADMVPANNRIAGNVSVAVHDVGVVAIAAPADTVPPGSLSPLAVLRNWGTDRPAVRAFFAINSTVPYRDSVVLPAGLPFADTLVAFPAWNATIGSYQARCSVAMAGDGVASNNVVARAFTVASSAVDIGVLAIVAPQGQYDTAATILPEASFRNWGDVTTTFTALFRILDAGGAQVYARPLVVAGLAPGRDTAAAFAEWPRPHLPGSYSTRCSVYVAGDTDPANDVAAGSFSVGESRITGWFEKTSMPIAPSGRAVKDGGWLSYDAGTGVIYAAKGYKTGDFYAYRPEGDSWSTLEPMPVGAEGRFPSKGAVGCANGRNVVYATKGNNSLGFWAYDITANAWLQLENVPLGLSNKKVKGGTDLAYIERNDTGYVYLLKGYRNEFYRYNTTSGAWQTLPAAPVGLRPKWDKGSWLALDGVGALYAHKARYQELWRYDVAHDSWTGGMLSSMPLTSRFTGRRKRSKDGGSGVFWQDHLFALKGGNSQDFFRYSILRDTWDEIDTMPIFGSALRRKRVKAGADITRSDALDVFFALKGNKTRELWMYVPGTPYATRSTQYARTGVQGEGRAASGVVLLVPSPARGTATIRWHSSFANRHSTLSLYDAAGRAVLARSLDLSVSGSLSLSGLPAGVYLVKLSSPGFTATRKLVIQH